MATSALQSFRSATDRSGAMYTVLNSVVFQSSLRFLTIWLANELPALQSKCFYFVFICEHLTDQPVPFFRALLLPPPRLLENHHLPDLYLRRPSIQCSTRSKIPAGEQLFSRGQGNWFWQGLGVGIFSRDLEPSPTCWSYVGGATPLNPFKTRKIKPPFAFFYIHLGGLRGYTL